MEALFRFVSGVVAGVAALFAPIHPLVITTLLFIGVDFISGIFADRAVARREGREWYFESCKAWRTVVKMGLAVTAIVMAWLLDRCVLDFMQLNLAKLFTGFTCGVEFWSFLENAAQLSEAPLFRWLRRYAKRRVESHLHIKDDDYGPRTR
ncbi:MAG TPA: phage holin family protein [Candidatus Alistipes intestinigallinarum]|uniref:Phage holin family protein n=1 Tax=Candidatus Alistipes intestinigallinarum TaxID=2838440 RepID=A0A9D1Z075_9BACT|nr:phage holin family protein [Candidatus Alistipes intestinigallinarum]